MIRIGKVSSVLLALACCLTMAAQNGGKKTVTVTGHVYDAGTKEPLE